MIKSRTILFNYIMLAIESLHGSIHLMEPVFSQQSFAWVSIVLGVVHSVGGHYMRTITTKPLSER